MFVTRKRDFTSKLAQAFSKLLETYPFFPFSVLNIFCHSHTSLDYFNL